MTTENLKSALEYAVELNEHGLEILTAADGTEYYDANKFNLKELDPKRYPKTLELSTLTSLVDYLKTDLNNLKNQRLTEDIDRFKTAKTMHSISHDLLDILDGKSVKEVLTESDEEDSSFVGSIAINVETGKVEGIDGIKDTKVKEQILAAESKVVEELGGN